MSDTPSRVRREPPPFRRATVTNVELAAPWLQRVTVQGTELKQMEPPGPAASVRLLLPDGDRIEMPEWSGNEFRRSDGTRASIRTLTPLRFDAEEGRMDLEIVVHDGGMHDGGVLSDWAGSVKPGSEVALSGPGRATMPDATASAYVIAADEVALPAVSQLLAALPAVPVQVFVECRPGLPPLPQHPEATIVHLDLPVDGPPGDNLVAAVMEATLVEGVHVWAAGEAAAMQRLRQHLSGPRGLPRTATTVRGYWKVGRSAGGDD